MFRGLLLSFLLVCGISTFAQKYPFLPTTYNFNYRDYVAGAQNWSVTEDGRGLIYVANQGCVMYFNGNRWNFVNLLNSSVVRSLDADEDGKIYLGAVGDFGFVYHDPKLDSLTYFSLTTLLKEEDKSFGDVWKTFVTEEKVFFQTFSKIFVFDKAAHTIAVITPFGEGGFHLSFEVDNAFFVNDKAKGLCIYAKGELLPISGGEYFNQKRIYALLQRNDRYWVVTRESGIEVLDLASGVVAPFENTETNQLLIESQVYNAIVLNDSIYAFATLANGVFIIDSSGEILFHFDKSNNTLIDQNIKNLYFDKSHRLWLAMDNGVAIVDFSSDLYYLNDRMGIKGTVNKLVEFRGDIYAATTQGLFKVSSSGVSQVENINTQCWDLLVIPNGADSLLIAATTNGIYLIQNEISFKIDDSYTYCLSASQTSKNVFYGGAYNGVNIYQINGQKDISFKNFIPNLEQTIKSIAEDSGGNLWLGVPPEGVFRVASPLSNSPQIKNYRQEDGLDDITFDVVFNTSKGIKIGTYLGIYRLDETLDKFIKDPSLGEEFSNGTNQVFTLTEDYKKSGFWIYTSNSKSKNISLASSSNEHVLNGKLNLLKNILTHTILPKTDESVWFGGAEGIQVYFPLLGIDSLFSKKVVLGNVIIGKDSTIHFGSYGIGESPFDSKQTEVQSENRIFTLNYSLNTVSIVFSSPDEIKGSTISYASMLEGYETDWSEWSLETKRNYTNLYEGTYVFKVKSKNAFGVESDVTTYTFVINAPWYRTWWAYALYSILAVVLVFAIVQMSLYRIKKQKELLEKTVKERTKEIQQQKAEIEIQKQVVEEKNKDITDSIQYAKKIQVAILPSEQALSSYFNEHFVLFKPRDIVSGDFFWAHQSKNKVVWIAADCTGHGVPGAFMSMIGTSLLNEIVIENGVFKADLILNEMREKIIKALGQTGAAGQQKDGMDLALCVLDKETGILSYSGANNPLWIFREQDGVADCQEVKADKQPIGYLTEEKKPFTCHEIQTQKGDLILTFTDGFADQFGGPKGKKYMYKPFRNLLAANMSRPVSEIKIMLDEEIEQWKNHPESQIGHVEQIDDICVFGVRI